MDVVVCACNPSAGQAEVGGFLGLTDHILFQITRGWLLRSDLWPPYVCAHTNINNNSIVMESMFEVLGLGWMPRGEPQTVRRTEIL